MFVVAPGQIVPPDDTHGFYIRPDFAGEVARHETLIGAIRATPSRLPNGIYYGIWEVGDSFERRVTLDEMDDARIECREDA